MLQVLLLAGVVLCVGLAVAVATGGLYLLVAAVDRGARRLGRLLRR